MPPISTSRLDLVPATPELLRAELGSSETLAAALGANVPDAWPPGEYDRQAIEFFKSKLSESPDDAGWYSWYALLRGSGSEPSTAIGAGGYFGPPNGEGIVEVGYSILPAYERRGFATELVRALVHHAFSTGRVQRIIAHTTPANAGSVRVLEKCGFRAAGPGKDPGTVRYVRDSTGG